MALTSGTRLGPYEILAPLGAGGMGEVYKARDTRLARTVAIKVLPADAASDAAARARFDREARAIAALSHPHICVVYDVGHQEGIDYLVMELLDGETLAERLARAKGPLPLGEVLTIGAAIADALDKAHRAGIVHRDLKPANVMLTKSGPKLLDFGLAKLHGTQSPVSLSDETAATTAGPGTAKGTILGTIHYMSPEQVEGREADPRSDIWALGALLYEMATGQRPFDGESAASIVGAIMQGTPVALSARQPLTPPSFEHIVERCLGKDPDERWQSVRDLRQELLWAKQALVSTAPDAVAGPVHSSRSLSSLATIVAVVLAAAVGAGISWRVHPSAPGPKPPVVTRLELNMPQDVEAGTANTPNLAVSPDGLRVAFIGSLGGVRRIYVRTLDNVSALPLKGTETVNVCTFSPDGHAIAFIGASRSLRTVSLADGLVTTLSDDVSYNGGIAWGPDNQITYGKDGVLWQIPAGGGATHRITTLVPADHEALHAYPAIIDGGRALLMTVVTATDSESTAAIDAVEIQTGSRHRVVSRASNPLYAGSGQLVFFRNGTLLAAPFDIKSRLTTGAEGVVLDDLSLDQFGNPMFSASATGLLSYVPAGDGSKRLVLVTREGAESPLTDVRRAFMSPRLSPDGRQLVIEVAGTDLWSLDMERHTLARFTSGATIGSSFPAWTPDSRQVLMRTVAGIYRVNADDGRGGYIAGTTGTDMPSAVSPDGRTLAYIHQGGTSAADILTTPLNDSFRPAPLVVTPGYDGGAQFSPDGTMLAYVSNESGRYEVYLRETSAVGRGILVSVDGGTQPKWSRDGRELFFRYGNRMYSVAVERSGGLHPAPARVLFEQRFAYGNAQTLPNYDVMPDGKHFVMVKDDTSAGRINIVLNWFQDLNRLVPVR